MRGVYGPLDLASVGEVLSVTTFGAVADHTIGVVGSGTDNGPAFQRAFDAARARGGARVFVPPAPRGFAYDVRTLCNPNGNIGANPQQRTSFEGVGSGSKIHLGTGSGTDTFWFNVFGLVHVHDLCFIGEPAPSVYRNCGTGLYFFQDVYAILERVGFWGIYGTSNGALVRGEALEIREGVHVFGCGVNDDGALPADKGLFLIDPPVTFRCVGQFWAHDSGSLDGDFYQKNNSGDFLLLDNPPMSFGNTQGEPIEIRGLGVDEASGYKYHVRFKRTNGLRYNTRINVRDPWFNRPASADVTNASMLFDGCDNVDICGGYDRFNGANQTRALEFRDCGRVRVRAYDADERAVGTNTIVADAACEDLQIEDSTFRVLTSDAQRTRVQRRDGVRGRVLRADGAIAPLTLVAAAAVAGRCRQFTSVGVSAAVDYPAACIGVCYGGLPAVGQITPVPGAGMAGSGETVTVPDRFRTIVFEYRTAGAAAAGRYRILYAPGDSQEVMCGRLANALNDKAGQIAAAGFQLYGRAIAEGGVVRWVNQFAGAAGNVAITETVADAGYLVSGCANGADVADGDYVLVADLEQDLWILTDGDGALVPGDRLTMSTSLDGRMRKSQYAPITWASSRDTVAATVGLPVLVYLGSPPSDPGAFPLTNVTGGPMLETYIGEITNVGQLNFTGADADDPVVIVVGSPQARTCWCADKGKSARALIAVATASLDVLTGDASGFQAKVNNAQTINRKVLGRTLTGNGGAAGVALIRVEDAGAAVA